MARKSASLFSRELVLAAIRDSFPKLDPRSQVKNPVMFIVELGSVITTVIFVLDLARGRTHGIWFVVVISVWLWLTVLFANFAEAIAEGRGKAQANALRATRTTTVAHRRSDTGGIEEVPAPELQRGDVVVVSAGEIIPADGEVIEGVGSVDESAITGESAPVIREAGGDQASEFVPVDGVSANELAEAAQLSSLADETPEGRSIVVLAKERYGLRGREVGEQTATFIPFSATTRMSGVDLNGHKLRKGAADAVKRFVEEQGGRPPARLDAEVDKIARAGGTPLVVAQDNFVLGVIYLKDIVKGGMRERFDELRKMGIRTVMITGDNRVTAAVIAQEAGVDDFLAEATPEAKMALIKEEQAKGRLVAMTGDGTNDAPALAQADVGVAMNAGTSAAKEAGNMVDLDNNPTKLIEVVEVGKQLLITRGALTTFSIANDVAKYFAILPAIFAYTYAKHAGERGPLNALNVMHLGTPKSAIVSAIIFNALIIPALVPLALRGVKYRAIGATALLRRNLLIYGLGGVILPFIGIKLIDLIVHNLFGA
jgi:K+-transporting ATPase ATPase B chain